MGNMEEKSEWPPTKYDDIIDLPHPVSVKHPPLSDMQRAAQFAPFAALTGFEEKIDDTADQNEILVAMEVEKMMDYGND